MAENKNTKLQIRNSTVDFLVFTKDAHEDGIEVRVQDHDVWLTQKAIGQLFDVDRSVVTKHLKNIYESGELSEESTCANFAQVADNGKTYQYKFYSLSAIIAVGYRVNSGRATQFRQWATKVLDTFAKQGYVLDACQCLQHITFPLADAIALKQTDLYNRYFRIETLAAKNQMNQLQKINLLILFIPHRFQMHTLCLIHQTCFPHVARHNDFYPSILLFDLFGYAKSPLLSITTNIHNQQIHYPKTGILQCFLIALGGIHNLKYGFYEKTPHKSIVF